MYSIRAQDLMVMHGSLTMILIVDFICCFFQDGTVQDLIERTFIQGGYIPELNILHMFKSLCDAILAFHSLDPPLAHRDIKVGRVWSYVIDCRRQFSWESPHVWVQVKGMRGSIFA